MHRLPLRTNATLFNHARWLDQPSVTLSLAARPVILHIQLKTGSHAPTNAAAPDAAAMLADNEDASYHPGLDCGQSTVQQPQP